MHSLKKKLVALLHFIIILFAYTSPFYIPWKIILGFIFLYYLQLVIFKGCILSQAEFGNKEDRFVQHYFQKFTGIEVERKRMDFILDYIIPALLLSTALLYQLMIKG